MATNIFLTVGDGQGSDTLDLMDFSNHFVLRGGFSAPPAPEGESTRTVTLEVLIRGATADAAWTNYQNLQTKITQARRARGPFRLQTPVTLTVKFETSSEVYFDVIDGEITIPPDPPNYLTIPATITLTCLRYARGTAVVPVLSPTSGTTLTNGTGSSVYLADLPGDAPGLMRWLLSDVSVNSKVINRVHHFSRSLADMGSTDFQHAIELAAAGVGAATTDSSSYSGSNFIRALPGGDWTRMASVDKPNAQYTSGLFDLWLRCRDTAVGGIPAPENLAVTISIPSYHSRTLTTGSDSSAEATISVAPIPGHLLTIALGINGNVTPTTPGGWTLRDSQVNGTACGIYLYERIADGTETTFSITLSGSPGEWSTDYVEWKGTKYTSPFDKSTRAIGTGTAVNTGTTTTLAQNYELVIGAVATGNTTGTATPGSGYTELADSGTLYTEYKTTTATTGVSATATLSGSTTWAAIVVTYRFELFALASTSVPDLPNGTYSLIVTALDSSGNESAASNTVNGDKTDVRRIHLLWDAPAFGTVTQYRVYWNSGSGWSYRNTGSTYRTYAFWTTSGGTAGDPPSAVSSNSTKAEFRAAISLVSGTTLFHTLTQTVAIGASIWEDVFLGTVPLPPLPALDGSAPQDWQVDIEVRSTGASPTDFDVDLLWLAPHDEPQCGFEYDGLDLVTKRDWMMETRRDGITTGHLRQTGTSTEAGQLAKYIPGVFEMGPGDAMSAFRCEITGGESDVDNARFTLVPRYIPRYNFVRGD